MHQLRRIVLPALIACIAFSVHAATAQTTATSAWELPPIQIVDEKGAPVQGVETAIVGADSPFYFWRKLSDATGSVVFQQGDYGNPTWHRAPTGKVQVLARAKGKAITLADWELPTSDSLTIKVNPGKPMELRLTTSDKRAIPAGLSPVISLPQFLRSWFPLSTQMIKGEPARSSWAQEKEPGTFEIYVDETSTAPLSLLLDAPGFLRGYHELIETTAALQNGHVELTLPEPGTLSAHVTIPDNLKSAEGKPISVSLSGGTRMGSKYIPTFATEQTKPLQSPRVTFEFPDLAPGEYGAYAQAGTMEQLLKHDREGVHFQQYESVEIKSGETETLEFTYKEFDPTSLRGDTTATIRIIKQDGSPAAGMAVQLRQYLRDFNVHYAITSGTLNDQGTTVIPNLAVSTTGTMSYEVAKGEKYGMKIGTFRIKEGETSVTREFTIPPAEGDIAPDITLTDVYTSESVKLSDLRGKVVFLDFWATWCGPCQEPMAKMQAVVEENGDRWGDRVAVIGASIDDDTETVIQHVKKNGWNNVRHLWCGKDAADSSPSKIYGISGVPTAFLIDQKGKIIWRGHPVGFDYQAEIDKLLE